MALNLQHASYRKGDTENFYSESVPPNTSLTLERLQWGRGGGGEGGGLKPIKFTHEKTWRNKYTTNYIDETDETQRKPAQWNRNCVLEVRFALTFWYANHNFTIFGFYF